MTIGYTTRGYPVTRTILEKSSSCEYVRVRSFKNLAKKIPELLGKVPSCLRGETFRGGVAEGFRHVDLYHFFNLIALPPCRKPYVTTFETTLPRAFSSGRMMQRGIASMMSSQCRRLIALSEHAQRRQMAFDKANAIGELDKKITVLLPPQKVLVSEDAIEQKNQSLRGGGGPFRLLFVGKNLYRKGGSEIIKAAVEVRKDFEIEAFVIGDYEHVDYASSWKVDSAEDLKRLLNENEGWLHHFKAMPNDEVIALAKTCHVGLLPTRDDTFGYSVLEFQACGLPCITTDIRALPEVNNEEIGWLVNVPKLPNGCADFSTAEKMRELSRTIEKGLVEKLREALTSPEAIAEKGIGALNNIKANHSPETYGRRLGEIYEEALS
jgi:glycosyltransferase involved in cell wall biosynthesis